MFYVYQNVFLGKESKESHLDSPQPQNVLNCTFIFFFAKNDIRLGLKMSKMVRSGLLFLRNCHPCRCNVFCWNVMKLESFYTFSTERYRRKATMLSSMLLIAIRKLQVLLSWHFSEQVTLKKSLHWMLDILKSSCEFQNIIIWRLCLVSKYMWSSRRSNQSYCLTALWDKINHCWCRCYFRGLRNAKYP